MFIKRKNTSRKFKRIIRKKRNCKTTKNLPFNKMEANKNFK